MSGDDLVRSWKDPDHRDGNVEHPAGEIELVDTDYVGGKTEFLFTVGCCNGLTSDWLTCANGTHPLYCGISIMACYSYASCNHFEPE